MLNNDIWYKSAAQRCLIEIQKPVTKNGKRKIILEQMVPGCTAVFNIAGHYILLYYQTVS